MNEQLDIRFATVAGHELILDLYMPSDVARPPLIVWAHGGRWSGGTHKKVQPIALVDRGYAIASIAFRLSGEAPHPAQIHDLKGSIRFLRRNAGDFGFNAERIAIAGASSGAHLAALVGLTNGSESHEGEVGGNLDVSSKVAAVISYFGASNLLSILGQSTPHGLSVRVPALDLLLGGQPEDNESLAIHASPVFHVDSADPPMLLMHGDQDPQIPVNQTLELWGAARAAGLDVQLEIVHGAGHDGSGFFDPARLQMADDFLRQSLTN